MKWGGREEGGVLLFVTELINSTLEGFCAVRGVCIIIMHGYYSKPSLMNVKSGTSIFSTLQLGAV
jgi:hypothetical protein